jgi:hypothetical protein
VTYEPTREEKLKTIRLAQQLFENMMAEIAPDLVDYATTAQDVRGVLQKITEKK